ncbi:MAG: thiamine phosphate synthase [Candidatus Omnitrophica bacterium]|nr:thiamine phosphate synthase [Candidatus Omnitrophota bacterium]
MASRRLAGGAACMVQFRAKDKTPDEIYSLASELKKIFEEKGVIFIINDHLEIAHLLDVDGLHVGQSDTHARLARSILGQDKIIGVSCSNLKEAILAQEAGADYLGVGAVFATPTKSDAQTTSLKTITDISRKIKLPFFAIGGVTRDNISRVVSCGVRKVAVCRDVLEAKDMAKAVAVLKEKLR